jgi:hypothetical protein
LNAPNTVQLLLAVPIVTEVIFAQIEAQDSSLNQMCQYVVSGSPDFAREASYGKPIQTGRNHRRSATLAPSPQLCPTVAFTERFGINRRGDHIAAKSAICVTDVGRRSQFESESQSLNSKSRYRLLARYLPHPLHPRRSGRKQEQSANNVS